MIRPTAFGFNPVTAVDNSFQQRLQGLSVAEGRRRATAEFDVLVARLRKAGIRVHAEDDTIGKSCDAVFPNNWISFHRCDAGARVTMVYPMRAENRRLERRPDLIARFASSPKSRVVDMSGLAADGIFLEGTGCLVLDRVNKTAFVCRSQRVCPQALERFCRELRYSVVMFDATLPVDCAGTPDGKAQVSGGAIALQPIYHTNVMMSIGDTFAIVCTQAIRDLAQRRAVMASLRRPVHPGGPPRAIIDISESQVLEFAGNVLQLRGTRGSILVMSDRARKAFNSSQMAEIRRHCDQVVSAPLEVIETLGGGGARCMLAEIF